MAYTTPTPRTTGELITAAIWNTDIVDNIVFLRGSAGQIVTTTGTATITVNEGVKFLNFGNVSTLTISGITAPPGVRDGDVLYGMARAGGAVVIQNSATVSTGLSNDRVLLGGAGSFIAIYVGAVSKYLIIQHNQGGWIGYLPTWTNVSGSAPSVGNGTLSGFYFVTNNNVTFTVKLILGSTTVANTGVWLFSLPYSNAGSASQSVTGWAWNVHGGAGSPANSLHPLGGTYYDANHIMLITAPYGLLKFDTPFSWGNTDQLYLQAWYDLPGVSW